MLVATGVAVAAALALTTSGGAAVPERVAPTAKKLALVLPGSADRLGVAAEGLATAADSSELLYTPETETAFVDEGTRSVDAVTERACELLLLNPLSLAAQCEGDRRFELALWWAFWRSLAQKLRGTNERLSRFFSETGVPPPPTDPVPREATGSFRLRIGDKQELFTEQKLSRMEIHFLSSLSRERRLREGDVLFREGDAGDAMYVVVEGKVRISKQSPGAGEEALWCVYNRTFHRPSNHGLVLTPRAIYVYRPLLYYIRRWRRIALEAIEGLAFTSQDGTVDRFEALLEVVELGRPRGGADG